MKKIIALYEKLPVKIRLLIGMLIAANTAALFIYLACKAALFDVNYIQALAAFLIYRVCAFMANKQMPLIDENVAFMSSERTKWNLASFAVLMTTFLILQLGYIVSVLGKWIALTI